MKYFILCGLMIVATIATPVGLIVKDKIEEARKIQEDIAYNKAMVEWFKDYDADPSGIKIPESVTTLSSNAFSETLRNINIPEDITTLPGDVFGAGKVKER